MPSGRVHRVSTLAIAPLAGTVAGYAASLLGQQTGTPDGARAGVACILGVLFTLAVNPDLGLLESSFKSKLRNKRRLFLWWLLWYPYSTSLPHRHYLSHAPIIGTLGRLLYLLFFASFVFAVLFTAEIIPPENVFYMTDFPRWFMAWFIGGMAISDTFHWLLDVTNS